MNLFDTCCLGLADNMGAVLALEKGRCHDYGLLTQCRRLCAFSLAYRVTCCFRWVPSERNAADAGLRRHGPRGALPSQPLAAARASGRSPPGEAASGPVQPPAAWPPSGVAGFAARSSSSGNFGYRAAGGSFGYRAAGGSFGYRAAGGSFGYRAAGGSATSANTELNDMCHFASTTEAVEVPSCADGPRAV